MYRLAAIVIALLLSCGVATATVQYVEFYNSGTWTVPSGVTSATVFMVGGGSGGSVGGATGAAGIGGNAGDQTTTTVSVTPGAIMAVIVGNAGTGGVPEQYTGHVHAPEGQGSAGGTSTFSTAFATGGSATGVPTGTVSPAEVGGDGEAGYGAGAYATDGVTGYIASPCLGGAGGNGGAGFGAGGGGGGSTANGCVPAGTTCYGGNGAKGYINVSYGSPEVSADFTANITMGMRPLVVSFTDLSANSPTSWAWTFGDGATSTSQNNIKTYNTVGIFDVVLVASNSGSTSTATKIQYIEVTSSAVAPTCNFISSVNGGTTPLPVTFTDTSVSSDPIVAYTWDANGDGITDSTDRDFTYTYSSNGHYIVNHSVTNSMYTSYYQKNIVVDDFMLNVTILDSTSYEPVGVALNISLDDGQKQSVTNSYALFPVTYNESYVISVSGVGYTPQQAGITIDDSMEVAIYLVPKDPASGGISYTTIYPHSVQFICMNQYGMPIQGVNVTVQGFNTTFPDENMLLAIFGWTSLYSADKLQTANMTGVSGRDGGVVFMMTELIRYRINFVKESEGINETYEMYPKDSYYSIVLITGNYVGGVPVTKLLRVNGSLWAVSNETVTTLHGWYEDPNNMTSNVQFVVYNASEDLIYSENINTQTWNVSWSYDLSHVTGLQYTWGMNATQTAGYYTLYNGVTLHSRLIDLGIPEMYYAWICIAFLSIFANFFSGRLTDQGLVLFPIMVGIFWYVGWLNVFSYEGIPVVVAFVMVMGILMYIRRRKKVAEN